MAQDPKVNTQQQTQLDAQKAQIQKKADELKQATMQKAVVEKNALAEMANKSFDVQLKRPGSHAQQLLTTLRTLKSIQKAKQELKILLSELAHTIKQQLLKIAAYEKTSSGVKHMHNTGAHKNEELEAFRKAEKEIAAAREQMQHYLDASERLQEKLQGIAQGYDQQYQKLEEQYQHDRGQLTQEQAQEENQLLEARDQKLEKLDQVTAENLEKVEQEAQTKQADLAQAKQADLKEAMQGELLERANLKAEYNAERERLGEIQAKADANFDNYMMERITDPEKLEHFKANRDHYKEMFAQATGPEQIKVLGQIKDELGVSMSPRMASLLTRLVNLDEKAEALEETHAKKQQELTEKYEVKAQEIEQAFEAKQQALLAERDAAIAEITTADKEQRDSIEKQYDTDLNALREDFSGRFKELETNYKNDVADLQKQQAAEVADVQKELEDVQKKQSELQQKVLNIPKAAPTVSAKEQMQEAPEEQQERSSVYKTPTLKPPTSGTAA